MAPKLQANFYLIWILDLVFTLIYYININALIEQFAKKWWLLKKKNADSKKKKNMLELLSVLLQKAYNLTSL